MSKSPERMSSTLEDSSAKAQAKREARFQLWGWFLFILSASFFTASSLRSGDVLGLLGSLFFLGACLVSVVPLVTRRPKSSKAANSELLH